MDNLVRSEKYLSDCTGCEGTGCQECGYKKKVYNYCPVYEIGTNGNPIKILTPKQ
jgi:hypothetical protein